MGEGRDDKRKPRSDADCVVYGISPYNSNSMKSGNPYSGIYVAETARTLDLNGGSPDCIQGGMLVLQRRVYERHDQDARYKLLENVSETVSAKYGTGGGNTPIVVKYETVQQSKEWPMGVIGCLYDRDRSIRNRGGNVPIVLQRRFSNIMVQDTEIAPTIEAGGGEGGNNLPMILYEADDIQSDQPKRSIQTG